MNSQILSRPEAGEFNPYYDRYISLVPSNDVVSALEAEAKKTIAMLSARSEKDGDYRYAPGKWNVKELLGHINDTERIMCYRALRLSRNDKTPIEGYEQDDYVRFGPHAHVKLADLVEEFTHVRRATISFVRQLDAEAWVRRGVTNKFEISVRALIYVIAGHELHHRNILVERYFAVAA